MSKKILVTGGNGFIGSALVTALLKKGYQVRSFDNNWRGSQENLSGVKNQVEMVTGDIRDPKAVSDAMKGIDSVCHLAAINGTKYFYSKPDLVLEVAVKGMFNVMDGCKAHGIRELYFMSTSETYQTPPTIPTPETVPLIIPDPMNPRYSYAGGKIVSEMLLLHANPNDFDRAIIVRPHNVYGPRMGWEHVIPELTLKVKKRFASAKGKLIQLPIQGTGRETRSFIYVEDMVAGFLVAMEKGENRQIYHVGTQQEITISDLATRIGKFFGLDVVPVTDSTAPGGTARRCPDTAKIQALGFKPLVSLDAGLKITLDWYNNNAHLMEART